MGLVAVLLVNGLTVQKAEKGLVKNPEDNAAWKRLKWAAGRSVVLWGVVLLLGVLLPLEA